MRVFVDGKEMELYTIGHTAKILKKSVETIRSWERKKIIPKPMYKTKKVRLYHPLEIEAMRKAIRKAGKNPRMEDIQREMWKYIREARQEILHGPKQQDSEDGN